MAGQAGDSRHHVVLVPKQDQIHILVAGLVPVVAVPVDSLYGSLHHAGGDLKKSPVKALVHRSQHTAHQKAPVVRLSPVAVLPLVLETDVRAGVGVDGGQDDVLHGHAVFRSHHPADVIADQLLQAAQIQRHPHEDFPVYPQAQGPAVQPVQHADGFSRPHGVAPHVHGKFRRYVIFCRAYLYHLHSPAFTPESRRRSRPWRTESPAG